MDAPTAGERVNGGCPLGVISKALVLLLGVGLEKMWTVEDSGSPLLIQKNSVNKIWTQTNGIYHPKSIYFPYIQFGDNWPAHWGTSFMELGAGWVAQTTGGQCRCFLGNRQGRHLYSTPLSGWSSGVTWVATSHHPEYLSHGGFICLWATWIPQRGFRREVAVGRGSAQGWAGEKQQGGEPRPNLGRMAAFLSLTEMMINRHCFPAYVQVFFALIVIITWAFIFTIIYRSVALFFQTPMQNLDGRGVGIGGTPLLGQCCGAMRTACQEREPAGQRIQVCFSPELDNTSQYLMST